MASKDELAAEITRLHAEVERQQKIIADLAAAKTAVHWYPYPSCPPGYYTPYWQAPAITEPVRITNVSQSGFSASPPHTATAVYTSDSTDALSLASVSAGNVSRFELTSFEGFSQVIVSASGPVPLVIGTGTA